MNYAQAMQYLESREHFGIKLGLEGITGLLEKLNDPQERLKVIHVAGSNGKGSTCAMISSILQEAGFNVGLYISPHLVRFSERISINGQEIKKEEIASFLERIKPHVKDQTYFEIVTALAFLFFSQRNVDFVVLEVGMGGRLDATNIIKKPLVCVITSLTLEHTKHLGKTIEKIAGEKAGIIKEGAITITPDDNEGIDIIKKKCAEKNARFLLSRPSGMQPALLGAFQKINAGLAIKTAKALTKYHGVPITKQAIISGLKNVRWSGRIQYISPDFMVDCAHTVAGAHVLVQYLKSIKRNVIFVLSILEDKDYKGMMDVLTSIPSQIILTKAPTPRTLKPQILARECAPHKIIENPKEAVAYALSLRQKNELVVVTGSCYLVGEVLSHYG